MSLIPDEPKAGTAPSVAVVEKQPWPKALAEQAQAMCSMLADFGTAVTTEQVT